MPTGYTADVQNGKIETLSDYAYGCARAFGALIMMRDESSDTPIPESFEPNTKHHEDKLAIAEAILLVTPSSDECEQIAQDEFDEEMANYKNQVALNNQQHERYKSMLVKVVSWKAPEDHKNLKDFMIDQLNKSIEFDIHEPKMPVQKSGADWLTNRNDKAKWDINYHTRNIKEEIERTDSRNLWLSQLRESLA